MNDTPARVQAEFRKRLLALGATRRVRMVSGMFDAARAHVRAGQNRFAGDGEVPGVMMFRRLYGNDFDVDELAAISEHLRYAARSGRSAASDDA